MSTTRFKEAQERFGEYETALEEIRQGRKRSHWIWYIFPQLKGLGRSYNSEYYGIASLEEAKEYLGDAVLRGRLLEISKALMEHKEEDIHSIMGGIDAQKLRSSMTLFESAAGDDDGCKVFGDTVLRGRAHPRDAQGARKIKSGNRHLDFRKKNVKFETRKHVKDRCRTLIP